jgi:cobalamin biosynthesis protein CobT
MADEAKIVAVETTVSVTESIDYKSGKTGISMLSLTKKFPGDVSTNSTIKEAEEVWKKLIGEGKVLGQDKEENEDKEVDDKEDEDEDDKEEDEKEEEEDKDEDKEEDKEEEDEEDAKEDEDEEDEDEEDKEEDDEKEEKSEKKEEKAKPKAYTEMTIEELRTLCKERKIEKTKRGTLIEEANMGKLIVALEAYDEEQEDK